MIKLFENLEVSWDIEELEKEFIETKVNPINPNMVYFCPSGKPHWQYFPGTNIYFSRNFSRTFTKECQEINLKLEDMKANLSKIENLNEKYKETLQNFNFLKSHLVISKIMPNENVKVHADRTRKIALNIGLKNTNKWRILLSDTARMEEFENSNKQYTVLNDGEGCLLKTENLHAVESIEFSNKPRYIISYSL